MSTTESNAFVPVSQWPTLEELAVGFAEHLMPASSALVCEVVNIIFDGNISISHHFATESSLNWEVTTGPQKGVKGKNDYKAFEVRSGIFFVDFYKREFEEHVSLVWNRSTGQVIAGLSKLEEVEGQRRTTTDFLQGHVTTFPHATPFPETDELLGRHILYRYSPRDAYEHVYLNSGTLTWHCLSGTEKGLADTEFCRTFKLCDQLYLLFWTETIMPVESFVVVDLQKMRSTGRFYCWDPKPQRVVQMLFGSYATHLAKTDAASVVASSLLPQSQTNSAVTA
ncbi:molybdenum cofactor biosynthesis protein F [Aspergillus pseudocaelatus]|uniref:Molybdenum cofactor biosynthesis protein F n=1 Tax=Aspergillus pseudocaelatus TaxID=1825620 RepID=A0ABQ6WZF9_9EURO|nr:molybdenum cofactor biosynthesis protein F [Aspergillus pseudocaelatus]